MCSTSSSVMAPSRSACSAIFSFCRLPSATFLYSPITRRNSSSYSSFMRATSFSCRSCALHLLRYWARASSRCFVSLATSSSICCTRAWLSFRLSPRRSSSRESMGVMRPPPGVRARSDGVLARTISSVMESSPGVCLPVPLGVFIPPPPPPSLDSGVWGLVRGVRGVSNPGVCALALAGVRDRSDMGVLEPGVWERWSLISSSLYFSTCCSS